MKKFELGDLVKYELLQNVKTENGFVTVKCKIDGNVVEIRPEDNVSKVNMSFWADNDVLEKVDFEKINKNL
jgi:hypothetical protein